MTIINLSTPLSDDKEMQRRNEVILAAIEQYTEERMNDEYGRIHTDGSRSGGQPIPSEDCPKCERFGDDCGQHSPSWQELAAYWKAEAERLRQPTQSDEWQAGYEAGVEAAATALEADARLCDCAARAANECACGAWDDYKSITSARAVEIVLALKDTK